MASEKVKSEYEKQSKVQKIKYWMRIIGEMKEEAGANANYDFHGEFKKLLDENPHDRNLIAEARQENERIEKNR
jgi:hypothetical protein